MRQRCDVSVGLSFKGLESNVFTLLPHVVLLAQIHPNTAVFKFRAEDIAFQATKKYGGVVLSDAESNYQNGSDFLMAAKVRLPYD